MFRNLKTPNTKQSKQILENFRKIMKNFIYQNIQDIDKIDHREKFIVLLQKLKINKLSI